MRKISKILFAAISSLSLMFSANAGEVTISGSAKATYNATSGTQVDNTIGISNVLSVTASGEMDNGYTWSYSMAMDPDGTDSGTIKNDDTSITLGMNDMGTFKVCVSTCGNNKKYAWDASAYGKMSDTGLSEGIVYPDDEGSYATLQYHTPELPFGTTASLAYGTPKNDGDGDNAQGVTSGDSANFYSLVTKPIDGLTLSASYYEKNDYGNGTNDSAQQGEQGGAYAAKYAYGNLTLGYGKSFKDVESNTAVTGSDEVEFYENTGISIGYAVNDELSVSYTTETGENNYRAADTTEYDIEMDSIQIAYSLGGATLSLARTDYENIGYSNAVSTDATETFIAMSFAF